MHANGRSGALHSHAASRLTNCPCAGHLLVDGAVEPFEVFRATFGGPLVCGRKEMAMASPLDACSELSARDVAGR